MNQEKERRIGEGIDGAAARQQEQSFPTFLVELTVKCNVASFECAVKF